MRSIDRCVEHLVESSVDARCESSGPFSNPCGDASRCHLELIDERSSPFGVRVTEHDGERFFVSRRRAPDALGKHGVEMHRVEDEASSLAREGQSPAFRERESCQRHTRTAARETTRDAGDRTRHGLRLPARARAAELGRHDRRKEREERERARWRFDQSSRFIDTGIPSGSASTPPEALDERGAAQ